MLVRMSNLRTSLFGIALFAAACASTPQGHDAKLQGFVVELQQQHENLLRLTVHATRGPNGSTVIASTKVDRLGTASDPEDLRAMQTGQNVVLEEGANLDITVPIQKDGGSAKACVGVTLAPAPKKSRQDQIAHAESIARAVERAMAK